MRTEEVFCVYSPLNTVSCCGVDLLFDQLVKEEVGDLIGCIGRPIKTIYYNCPMCKKILVYDRGDNFSLELVKGTS